jgi:hypothetical protein
MRVCLLEGETNGGCLAFDIVQDGDDLDPRGAQVFAADSRAESVHDAVAIDELLDGAGRCQMRLGRMLDQLKGAAELGVQGIWRIPHDRQSTALQRAVRAEGRDDHMPTRPHCTTDLRHLSFPLPLIRQEMEDRPVMPNIECLRRQSHVGDIAEQPVGAMAQQSHPLARHLKRGGRDVQNTDIKSTEFKQIVNKSRSAGPDINHMAMPTIRNLANQI